MLYPPACAQPAAAWAGPPAGVAGMAAAADRAAYGIVQLAAGAGAVAPWSAVPL